MKNSRTFCLFQGRHELPPNEGPLFDFFDFENFRSVGTTYYQEAVSTITKGGDVKLYVTGLTPALTHFLAEVEQRRSVSVGDAYDASLIQESLDQQVIGSALRRGTLTLMHFNNATKNYEKQLF